MKALAVLFLSLAVVGLSTPSFAHETGKAHSHKKKNKKKKKEAMESAAPAEAPKTQ